MKVFAIASALLFACSTAAAVSSPSEPAQGLAAREAAPEALPGWWGFRWSRRGHGGWKRDASAAPEAEPWWRWSRRGQGGWKRDASAAPEPFNWSRRGQGGWKRDVSEEDDFIYLPDSMTPDDFAAMLTYDSEEPAPADTE